MTQISELSFEEALKELEVIVKSLEDGQGTLDHAIVAYEKGIKLKAFCEEKLSAAKLRIEQITAKPDGSVSTSDFIS
jgi:exodeoxyribonuclease VII small subunit